MLENPLQLTNYKLHLLTKSLFTIWTSFLRPIKIVFILLTSKLSTANFKLFKSVGRQRSLDTVYISITNFRVTKLYFSANTNVSTPHAPLTSNFAT